ncbi:MAG: ABC transporter ATP-binding protein [Bacteroidetes bacterium]|nr:MAG: ABC transporter ATP-binding protein [Bacteroidota bacterium]
MQSAFPPAEGSARRGAPLVEAQALCKRYPAGERGELVVLQDLSFHVMPGEVVAIVGESGTGKSTLLHLLGGLDRPTSGRVLFEGADVFQKDDEALAAFRNRSIGFVFQFHHLLPEFTAVENVAMPALIQHRRMEEVRPRAVELLRTLGLGDRLDHRPGALSGGEQQRVAVARALMNRPRLVLADEPTGNLDTRTADALHRELLRLSRAFGQTFVIATHNLALAEMADRVLHLRQGRLHPAGEAAPPVVPPNPDHAGDVGEGD